MTSLERKRYALIKSATCLMVNSPLIVLGEGLTWGEREKVRDEIRGIASNLEKMAAALTPVESRNLPDGSPRTGADIVLNERVKKVPS
jgi:hypothetical protein